MLLLSHIHDIAPDVRVVVEDTFGSYTEPSGVIHIAVDDIKRCNHNSACIGFLVGHELGHQVLGHVRGRDYTTKWEERDADFYSMEINKKAGFNTCGGVTFFTAYLAESGGNDGGMSHPDSNIRRDYINYTCHSGNIPEPSQPWVGSSNFVKGILYNVKN